MEYLLPLPQKKDEAELPKLLSIWDMTKFDLDTFLCELNKDLSQLT